MVVQERSQSQLLLFDGGACWQIAPGARARYQGPPIEGLRSGLVGRVAEMRSSGALVDFGRRGRWRVPHHFLAAPAQGRGV